jgi:hypothetical protein
LEGIRGRVYPGPIGRNQRKGVTGHVGRNKMDSVPGLTGGRKEPGAWGPGSIRRNREQGDSGLSVKNQGQNVFRLT